MDPGGNLSPNAWALEWTDDEDVGRQAVLRFPRGQHPVRTPAHIDIDIASRAGVRVHLVNLAAGHETVWPRRTVQIVQACLLLLITVLSLPLIHHLKTAPSLYATPTPPPTASRNPPDPKSNSIVVLDIGTQTVLLLDTYTSLFGSHDWLSVTGSVPATNQSASLGLPPTSRTQEHHTTSSPASPSAAALLCPSSSGPLPQHWSLAAADLIAALESLVAPALPSAVLSTMTSICGGLTRQLRRGLTGLWDWECIRDNVLVLSDTGSPLLMQHGIPTWGDDQKSTVKTLEQATSLVLTLLSVQRDAAAADVEMYAVEGHAVDLAEVLITSGFIIGKVFADYADYADMLDREEEEGDAARIKPPPAGWRDSEAKAEAQKAKWTAAAAGDRKKKRSRRGRGTAPREVAFYVREHWPSDALWDLVEAELCTARRLLDAARETQEGLVLRMGDLMLGLRAAGGAGRLHDGGVFWDRVKGFWAARGLDARVKRVEGLLERMQVYASCAERTVGPALDKVLAIHRSGMAVHSRERDRLEDVVEDMVLGKEPKEEWRRVVLGYREAMWPREMGWNVTAATQRLVHVAEKAWEMHGHEGI